MSPDGLSSFFQPLLENLHCEQEGTRDYILGILQRPDVVKLEEPAIVLYERARTSGRFELSQKLADTLFWTRVFAPEHLRHATVEYYEAIGACSYERCHVIMRGQWPVYKELSGRFGELARETRSLVIR